MPDAERRIPGFLSDVEPYPTKRFWEDLLRVTEGRADPELGEILIGRSYDTVRWLAGKGIVLEPALSLSGVRVGDKIKWSPGAVIRAEHEGVGLSRGWFEIAERAGVEIRYETSALRLLQDRSGRVTGVTTGSARGFEDVTAGAVVLGCGGFEANPAWRARYLGRPWDHAKVRGTRYNTGDGLRMAIEIQAPCRSASGRAATRRPSTPMPRPTGTASSPTRPIASRIRTGCSSTIAAGASSTRARTSSSTLTPSSAASS